jgi:hypothetical protein
MKLTSLLEENRAAILARWFELIAETYPDVTSKFLAKQKDRFRNPVGHAIIESIGPIYDELVSALDTDRLLDALDGIIRIRSVQDFTPSETIGFVFALKGVIREVLGDRIREPENWNDLVDLESRIDRVALLAFEKYTECREQLHRVRNREIQNRAMEVLERVKLEPAISVDEEEPTDDDA